MQLKCVIIEDEPLAMEKLQGFVSELNTLTLVASFENALDGLNYIKTHKTDVLFLDIQMPQLSGIQLLESFSNRPQVVIVSAYDQYALKGYEFCVTDYLLKPYSFNRFLQAVDKVIDRQILNEPATTNTTNSQGNILFVKSGSRIERIDILEILYIQGMKDYQQIVCNKRKIMTLQNLKTINEALPEESFIRVHKSYIVNIHKIESIERNRIKINEELIPVSDTYKNTFYKSIQQNRNLI